MVMPYQELFLGIWPDVKLIYSQFSPFPLPQGVCVYGVGGGGRSKPL